ncbi:hypothetical protein ACIBW9_35050 [Streptomyces sp. NPDC049541]|uniref:hypothetical protein n=1 Tax=Streptomyces sp. NPDC049541 TaxID=3365594 RepID=UPI0037BC6679
MPSEPELTPASPADAEQTAILDAVDGAPAPRGYGDRFAEDAFDYPSPQATHAWSADAASATAAGETDTVSRVPAQGRGRAGSKARGAGGWRQVAGRHQSVLLAAAALVVLGGFGLALSSVSQTVSSNPTPGGTAQVSAPRSPTARPLPPDPADTPEPPGSAAVPTQTSSSPGAGEDRDREKEHGREEQGREDGNDADD